MRLENAAPTKNDAYDERRQPIRDAPHGQLSQIFPMIG